MRNRFNRTIHMRAVVFLWILGLNHVLACAQLADTKPKADTNQWEAAIKAFEAADKTNPPPRGGILFIGSSSIRMWKTLTNDFAGYPVFNRGFGGSQISDSVRYSSRIITPYQPRAIVFYAGDNDLAMGKSPAQIAKDFKRLVYKVHWRLSGTRIFVLSVKPSPARWHLKDQVLRTNQLIEEYSKTEKNVKFIDVFSSMLGADGTPRKELFAKDNLHMNEKGYQLWTSLIKPHLAEL
jgi:lysophospholipase L1-like esterase